MKTNKSKLKDGDIVLLGSGKSWVVKDGWLRLNRYNWISLDAYNDDLTLKDEAVFSNTDKRDYSVVAINGVYL